MPDEQGRLFADECAERIGIGASDWRARVSRNHAPAPVDWVLVPIGKVGKASRPVWDPQVIADYLTARQARMAKTDQAGPR